MTKLLHPTRGRLQAWLSGEDSGLDRHVETCHRCANRLDEMAPTPSGAIREALSTVLAPPDALATRLEARLVDAIASRDDLKLLLEMLGLPVETFRTVLADPPQHRPHDRPGDSTRTQDPQ